MSGLDWRFDMSFIKKFEKDSKEYDLLKKAALMLTFKSPNRWDYYVGETYFDFGQNWKWTTVLCSTGEKGCLGSYQALSPRDQEMICVSDGSVESMASIADGILSGDYCPDRIKSVA